MTTTDLKPGDIVQHPEHGFGFIVLLKKDLGDVPASEAVVRSTNPRRNYGHDWDLTGWERVETVRPGHVQVRVDDLDPGLREGVDEAYRRLCRAWGGDYSEAQAAQRAESTPTADEQNATIADESPAMTGKTGDEQPASATVELHCPDCGGAENVTVVMLGRQSNGERWFDLREFHAHTCPPAQPEEPTEAGVKLTFGDARLISTNRNDDGLRIFTNVDNGSTLTWLDITWIAKDHGTQITLGWDE